MHQQPMYLAKRTLQCPRFNSRLCAAVLKRLFVQQHVESKSLLKSCAAAEMSGTGRVALYP